MARNPSDLFKFTIISAVLAAVVWNLFDGEGFDLPDLWREKSIN